jgi:hypothetical protein
MVLSEGAGRAPRVHGEPSSDAWKLIKGCQTLERGESLFGCRPTIERSGSSLEGG